MSFSLLDTIAVLPDISKDWTEHWIFFACSVFAICAAAVGGATASSRVRMDMFGICCCGTITALGGGTVRDMLLSGRIDSQGNAVMVYWVDVSGAFYLYLSLGSSLLVFYITRFYSPPAGTIRIADTFAMAFFAVIGTDKAYGLGCSWVVCVLMGICTGVAGGALRDLLTGSVPYVFRPGELYATAAFIGCITYVMLRGAGCPEIASFLFSVLLIFMVRITAVYLNWQLPAYQPIFEDVRMEDQDIDNKNS